MGSEKGGAGMKPESKRATVAAVAQSKSPSRLYRRVSLQASIINDTLAALIFSLHGAYATATERTTVLSVLDDLIRLKIDAGLFREGKRL
jgi:hypothetical protein